MSNELDDRAQQDAELEEFLRGGSEVSQRYREFGGHTAVPPMLDQKVLSQARQHSAGGKSRRSALRWGAPLAVAASVFITLSIVLQPGVQRAAAPQPALVGPAPTGVMQSDAGSTAALSSVSAEKSASPDASPADEQRREQDARSDSARRTSAPTAGLVSTSPPSIADAPSAVAASQASRLRLSAAEPQVPDASESKSDSLRRAAQDPAMAPSQPLRDSLQAEVFSSVASPAAAPEEVKRQAPAKEVAESPAMAAAKLEQATRYRAERPESERNFTTMPAAQASDQAVSEPQPPPEGSLEQDRTFAPATWVEWIRQRREQGKQQEAERLLKRLRAAYPDFAVPVDIAVPASR